MRRFLLLICLQFLFFIPYAQNASGPERVEDFPKITEELVKRGYGKKDIRKIPGGNLLRVLAAVEK